MNFSITQVPLWLSVLFIISFSTVPLLLILKAIKSAYKNGNIKYTSDVSIKIILFYTVFF